MSLKHQFVLLAAYNQWMNSNLYEAAGQLSAAELAKDRGAFFGSVLGTLNHILVGDILWRKRFATDPASLDALRPVAELQAPTRLDQTLHDDLGCLAEQRIWLDRLIINWIAGLSDKDLGGLLSYRNTKGVPANKRYSSLILHFFNHQTHHRGQVSALLSQAGVGIGVTDLLALIPEETPA